MAEISGIVWPPEGRAAAYWQAESWLEDQDDEECDGVPEPDEVPSQLPGSGNQ